MEKHKSKALEDDCLCSKCEFRFQCFTQERVFSDPIFQGLFEALMAQGKSRKEALDEVTEEIKFRMTKPEPFTPHVPEVFPGTYVPPPTIQPYVGDWYTDGIHFNSDNVSFGVNDLGALLVTYTMHDGKEVSWVCR